MPRIDVEITHADRVLFPDDGITKGDVVAYYSAVASAMLPHLKGRPLMLQRFPRGIDEAGFVQKDFEDNLPGWMSWAEVPKQDGTVVHALAERPEALTWLANQDSIVIHTWLSRQGSLDKPDRLVFDLDPSGADDFGLVRATARALAGLLDDLGLSCYLKTTGSRGLHVVVPLQVEADFDTAREFARDVAELVVADDPDHRTVQARKDKRGERLYLDVMRNAYAQTAVAPYSIRPRRGAPVATPLQWDELDGRGLRPDGFTIKDVPGRLADQGYPWADMRRHARSLHRPRERLDRSRA
jgi:bifunctional non-homologous end joining protein LigD